MLSDLNRARLILDFAEVDGAALLKFPVTTEPGIPKSNLAGTPTPGRSRRDGLLALATLCSLEKPLVRYSSSYQETYRRGRWQEFRVGHNPKKSSRRTSNSAVRAEVEEFKKMLLSSKEPVTIVFAQSSGVVSMSDKRHAGLRGDAQMVWSEISSRRTRRPT